MARSPSWTERARDFIGLDTLGAGKDGPSRQIVATDQGDGAHDSRVYDRINFQ